MFIYSHTLLYIESSILINIYFHTLINIFTHIFTLIHISVAFSDSSLTSPRSLWHSPQCGPCDTPAKDPWTSQACSPLPIHRTSSLGTHLSQMKYGDLYFYLIQPILAPKYAPRCPTQSFIESPSGQRFSLPPDLKKEKLFFLYTYASSLSAYPVNKESHAIWFLTRKRYNLPSTWESRHPLSMSINTFLRQPRRTQNHCETDIWGCQQDV